MNRNKELAKNTIIIALGKICTQFVTFFLLPVYTHFLTTAEYGTVDMVITCSGLIAPIMSLQMERAVFRYLVDARKDKQSQDKILSTALLSIIPSILLIAAVMPIIGIAFHLRNWLLIGLIIVTAIMSNVALQIPRGLGKNVHFSIGSMIVGILNALISIFTVVALHMGVTGVLLANVISHLAGSAYVFISIKLWRHVKFSNHSRKTLKELLKFSMPMIPNDISYWIISISDRVLIYFFLGDSFNGIYATSTKFPTLLVTLYNVFNLSWMETVSAHINDKDAKQYLSETYNMIVKLFASVCTIATAAIPFVFNIIIGSDFVESFDYVAVLIFGAFFNIIVGMLGSVYIGYKETKTMAKTTMLAAIINIIVNIAFIKVIGIWAAVISTLAAYAIVSFLRLINIQKTVQIKTDWKAFLFIIALFGVNIVLFMQKNFALNIVNLTIMIAVAVFMNLDFIRTTFGAVCDKAKKLICH